MIGILVQTIAEDTSADLGVYTQKVFNELLGIDIMLAFKMLVFWIFFIWVIFALWVAFDASTRYKSWYVSLFWFIFVLPFNVIGFIGYLFMRPVVTLEEKQWTNLEGKFLMQELSNLNDCPTCGTLVAANQDFCAVCGTKMTDTCSSCGTSQSIYNLHCISCGNKMSTDNAETVKHYEQGQAKKATKIHSKKNSVISQVKNLVTIMTEKRKAMKIVDKAKKTAKSVKSEKGKANTKSSKEKSS